jgi:hypothetical protein
VTIVHSDYGGRRKSKQIAYREKNVTRLGVSERILEVREEHCPVTDHTPLRLNPVHGVIMITIRSNFIFRHLYPLRLLDCLGTAFALRERHNIPVPLFVHPVF